MALNALKIQTADLVGKLVAQLSNRPTNSITSGGDNLTAQEVKERYDAYGHLLKDRFNALVDAIVADPSTETDALANYIKVYLGDPTESDPLSLADALAALVTAIAEKYSFPGGGIPAEDLATSVQTSLGKAETAYQKPGSGIPASDLAEAIRTILTNAVSQSEFAPVKALAEGAEKAEAAENYSALASLLSAAEKTAYKPGQKFLIGTYGVPDVGVLSVEDTTVSYTYTTDAAFEASLMAGTLQIGYFVLRPVEGKTNLADYATTADLDALINALVDGVMAVAEADYAESATYAQQADLANQINTDREIEDADTACHPAVFGTVGGNAEVQSGLMPFTELRGNTIKWNQLVQNGNFASTDGWTVTNGTITVSDNVAEITFTDTTAVSNLRSTDFGYIKDHKYLYRCQIKLKNTFAQTGATFGFSGINNAYVDGTTTDWQQLAYIDTASATTPHWGANIYKWAQTNLTGYYIKNIVVFDLTAIYGAGNEPSTVVAFVRDFPLPYYAHNPGTLLSSKSSSVDFIKRNQCPALDTFFNVLPNTEYEVSGITAGGYLQEFDGSKTLIKTSSEITSTTNITLTAQTVYAKIQATTYTDVLCYITWETRGLPYVPFSDQHITLPNIELRSAGSVYDVLYQQGGGKRRIGTVDLGTLNWTMFSSGVFYGAPTIAQKPYTTNYLCAKYDSYNGSYGSLPDKSMTGDGGAGTNIWIRDDSYSDAATFKTAIDGAMLYYELATETDITVEENPGWTKFADIDNFGTVKFNQDPAQTIPVPQAYFIRYTVNLVEFLDSLFVHCGGDVSKIALVE